MSTQTTTTEAASGAEGLERMRLINDPSIEGEVTERTDRYISIAVPVYTTVTRSPEAFEPTPTDGEKPAGAERVDLLDVFGRLRDLADDVRYSRHEPFVLAATARALAEEVRTAHRSGHLVPASLPAALGSGEGTAGATLTVFDLDILRAARDWTAPFEMSTRTGAVASDCLRAALYLRALGLLEYGACNNTYRTTDAGCLALLNARASDGSGEAGETHSGSTEGDSAVGAAEAPGSAACRQAAHRASEQMAWAKPQSPSLSEVEEAPTPDPVGEAKALLDGLPKWLGPRQFIEVCRKTGDHKQADRFEAALATLTASQEQDGEVRHG